MVTLVLATRDIVRSVNNFSAATDQQQKVEEMETLILGSAKACAVFGTLSSLYAAYVLVERRELQLILAGLTFCMHPVASLDIIGCAAGVYGIFKVGKAFHLHGENRKPIEKLYHLAREQAKKEGYRFYNRWNAILWKTPASPETMKRVEEIGRELRDKHFDSNSWAQLLASINKAWEYLISGLHHLGISALSGIGIVGLDEITKSTKPFWLDRKMVDFSKWLAPQIV